MSPAKHILHCLAYKCGIFLWGPIILDNLMVTPGGLVGSSEGAYGRVPRGGGGVQVQGVFLRKAGFSVSVHYHLINTWFDPNHHTVIEDFAIFAECLLSLQFRLVVKMHPVSFRGNLVFQDVAIL